MANRQLKAIAKQAAKGDPEAIAAVNEQAQRTDAIGAQAREAQKHLPPPVVPES